MKYISLNNRPCQTRPTLVVINSIETAFYWYTVSIIKFSGSCITLNDPHAQFCIPNKAKIWISKYLI